MHESSNDFADDVAVEQAAAVDALVAVTGLLHPQVTIHAESTGLLAANIARELALGEAAEYRLELLGRIHDIGVNGITPLITDQSEPLSEHEYNIIRLHPERGEAMLKAIPCLSCWAPIVRSHHERFDGSGYPDGLCGEEIPIESRLLAVADAFHAMTTTHPWRKAISPFAAVQELLSAAGTQFDERIVVALIRSLGVRSANASGIA